MFCKSTNTPPRRSANGHGSGVRGFTLVELLIVMAILGLLATIVAPRVGRAIDDAKAQKCRNNLKELHSAVLGYIADNGEVPYAQSFEYRNSRGEHSNKGGWVAWVPTDNRYEEDKQQRPWEEDNKKSYATEFRDDLGIGPDARYAVENGALFDYVGDIRTYVCPLVKAKVAPALEIDPGSPIATAENGSNIYRTYAMNPFFFCSQRQSWEHVQSSKVGVTYSYGGHVPEPAKLLLFTEVEPSGDSPPVRKSRTDAARNGAWKHDGCLNPEKWDSGGANDETIYAVHPSAKAKGATCALAVFFDGHVETVESKFNGKGNVAWFLNRGWTPDDKKPVDNAD